MPISFPHALTNLRAKNSTARLNAAVKQIHTSVEKKPAFGPSTTRRLDEIRIGVLPTYHVATALHDTEHPAPDGASTAILRTGGG